MSGPATSRRILIVDDEPDLVEVIAQHLRGWGYEPLAASTGEDGLQVAQAQRPDLILLDVLLPKMKGREVCAKLKTDPATQHIPVVFLSALGMPDHIQAGMALGAEDYLIKPIEAEELRDRIQVCLLRHERHRAAGA